jgi:site-specific recombinase XerD
VTGQHKTTLQFAVREYLLEGRARQFTASTIDHYRSCLSAFTRWAADQDAVTLDAVTPSLLRAYLVHLQERGLASNTQHTHARALRAFLNFCQREGLLAESPFAKVKMPRAAKVDKPALTAGDVRKLVRACDKSRDLALLLLALDTGARVSELCNLNVGDVDLDTLTVTIRQGKGRKDRTCYIGARTARAVSRYLGERTDTAAGAPLLLSESVSNVDGRLSRWGVRSILQELGQGGGRGRGASAPAATDVRRYLPAGRHGRFQPGAVDGPYQHCDLAPLRCQHRRRTATGARQRVAS